MRSTLGIFALGLATTVAAHEHNHMHLHERAASAAESCVIQTYTTTSYGEWALVPETSSVAPAPSSKSSSTSTSTTSSSTSSSSSSSSSTYVAPTTSSAAPPPPPPETTTSAALPPPETTTPAPSLPALNNYVQVDNTPAPAAAPAPTTTAAAPAGAEAGYISANGNKWAFCYTPYTSDGQCKSADQVASDLSGLKGKGFTAIRTYGTDCSTVANVGSAARANGLNIILGVPIDASGVGGAYGQLDTLASWGKSNWDLVEMVVVGNEPIFSGFTDAGSLASLIGSVKSKFKDAGYSGPVTTSEPLGTMQQYGSTLCPAIDVVGANIHPYFNDAVSAILAGPFVAAQLALLSAVCGGKKEAYVLETGWPSAGNSNGIAIPGIDAQKIAITGIMTAVGSKAGVFSFENDKWKNPGPYGVEQSWGCSGLF